MIWLIDYTHYKKQIDPELEKYRRDYFRIKSYKREKIIGSTAPVRSKAFSTGLLRIATVLNRNGYTVKYMDYEMLEKALNNGEHIPEVVAFSAVCPTVPLCASLAERIKTISPKTKVKIGGVHVNLNAMETKRRYPIFDELTVGYELEGAEKIVHAKLNPVNEIYVDYDGNVVKYLPSDFNKLKHAFMISIHKSQGSEFEFVILPICMSYFRMLYRKLIYTAITRAKRKLIIVGDIKAFKLSILKDDEHLRKTYLKEKLENMYNL